MDVFPEYLFHYTSLEKFCLILRSKSIRFTRLDRVNDPDEAFTKNFPRAKFFVFVSCWALAEENEESLPLWNMYSSNMKGVRIRLPINMFKGRRYPEKETTGSPIINVDGNVNIKRERFNYSSMIIGPSRVEYKEDTLNTNSCFTEHDDNTITVELLHLGLSKRNYWNFENEWRYRIIGMPFEGRWKKEDYDQFLLDPCIEYIDIPLDFSVLSELIVQLGPNAGLAESIMVELLLKEFAPNAKLCDSACKITG